MLRRLLDRFDSVGLNLPPMTRQRGIRRKTAIFIARLFLRVAQIISRDAQAEGYPCHEQDPRRRINLLIGDIIPDVLDVPAEVAIVELSFSMASEKLPKGQEQALEALARSLRTRGVDLVLKVDLDQGNWIHLRSWLKRAQSLDIAITPGLSCNRSAAHSLILTGMHWPVSTALFSSGCVNILLIRTKHQRTG